VTVDVRIRRCTLTIRRRDGWGWGAAPQPYVDAALSGVEAALEAAMAAAGVPAGAEAHLDEPVSLQFGSDGAVTAASWNGVVELLRSLAAAAAGGPRPLDEAGTGALGEWDEVHERDMAGEHGAGALARTLARWSRGGRMAEVVSAWPAALVRAWIEAIAYVGRQPGAAALDAPGALTAEAVELIADGVLGRAGAEPSEREAADRLLVLLGALTAALGDRLPDAATQTLARQRVYGAVEGPARQQNAADDERVTSAHQQTTPGDQVVASENGTTGPQTTADEAHQQAVHDDRVGSDDGTTHEKTPPDTKRRAGEDGTTRQETTPDNKPPVASLNDATNERTSPVAGENGATHHPTSHDDPPVAGANGITINECTTPDDTPVAGANGTANEHTTPDDTAVRNANATTDEHTTPDDTPIRDANATTHEHTAANDESLAGAAAATTSSPPRARAARATRQPTPVLEQVVPALPLLVLAQLSRIGYVDAMAGAAIAAGLPSGAGALGAAIAGKVLPPPRRGWRREPAEAAAIAIASGRPPQDVPEALAEIAAHEQNLVAPLAAALQGAYAEGRSANDEVVVWTGDEGIVCGEEEGLLPAAWVGSEAELDGALASLGRPPVRRDACFAPLAHALHERLGLPRFDAPALERQLGAAAGTALGLIALDLWGSPEQATTTLLALERLEDLEARVRSGPDGLLVSIPRGQRWLDLSRGGLLDLFAVPWLPAGRLEIGTW
jgi:hypothetical protein